MKMGCNVHLRSFKFPLQYGDTFKADLEKLQGQREDHHPNPAASGAPDASNDREDKSRLVQSLRGRDKSARPMTTAQSHAVRLYGRIGNP